MPKVKEALESADPEQNLRWAAQRNDKDKVIELLNAGVNIHTDYDGPLRDAAESGGYETVEVLLERGADPFALRAQAVRMAERYGHKNIVALLWKKINQEKPGWKIPESPLAFKVEASPQSEP
jgi:ankyrin repeat protein